ncbi:MAG TPA: class I SAM-dependent methyltransferase [Candidatus Limnocylindrales bacterium]|nr:class I SAM-dependent methyltransferase [Candidatus Limnocylindrales bacterium]
MPAIAAFDVIHARAVLTHLPERDEVLARLVAALRPGGWLLIEDVDIELFLSLTLDPGVFYATPLMVSAWGQRAAS